MTAKTALRLLEIEHKLGKLWLAVHLGQISHEEGNEKMQELEDKKERLWVQEAGP